MQIKIDNNLELRPTKKKIRETLFNWLSKIWLNNFKDKYILDLFSGSGSIGFEASYRGAAFVKMIDKNYISILKLRFLRNKMINNKIQIILNDSMNEIKLTKNRFNLIILDPPFNQNLTERILLYIHMLINKNGLLYIESEFYPKLFNNFKIIKSVNFKNFYCSLYLFNR